MAPQDFVFGLIGKEDLNIGGDTFPVTLPDGSVVPNYNKIGSHTFLDGLRNARQNGCACDGETDDGPALYTLANTTLQPDGGMIYFPSPDVCRISTDISLPSNVSLIFPDGAKLQVDGGKTVIIGGTVNADPRKTIFTGAGTVTMTSLYPVLSKYLWWSSDTAGFALNGQNANILDFGGAGDGYGNTDNLPFLDAAITAIKAAKGGTLVIPQSEAGFWINGSWTISDCPGLRIIMDSKMYNLDEETPDGTRIILARSQDSVIFENCKGLRLEGFLVDGSEVAVTPVIMDRVWQGYWLGGGVIRALRTNGGINLTLTETTAITDAGNVDFLFMNLVLWQGYTGLALMSTPDGGGDYVSGTFHCTFFRCRINYDGGQGIFLQVTDNVDFISTVIFRIQGSGPGVRWVFTDPYAPTSITFYGLQAGDGGAVFDAGVLLPGAIYSYDMSNGQPYPTIPTGTICPITTSGLNSPGWNVPQWTFPNEITVDNATAAVTLQDDDCRGLMMWSNVAGEAWRLRMNATTNEMEIGINPDGSGVLTGMTVGAAGPTIPTGNRLNLVDKQTSVGSAGGADALPGTPTGYAIIKIDGVEYVTPYYDKS